MPFHLSTIKNVSTTQDGATTFLRLNFHIPGVSTMQFPPMEGPNNLFIKELTLKNSVNKGGVNHLNSAFKIIKDLIKNSKVSEQANDNGKGEDEDTIKETLIPMKGKRDFLENLVIRPNIVGKKTLGSLEIHQNGVRFSSTKGH